MTDNIYIKSANANVGNVNVRAIPRNEGDNFTDVVVRVYDDVMSSAWGELEKPIKDSPEYDTMLWDAENDPDHFARYALSEEQLRLLCGTLKASVDHLPMGPFEAIRWVDQWDEKLSSRQYVGWFVAEHVANNTRFLGDIPKGDLKRLPSRIADYLKELEAWEAEHGPR